MTDFSYDLSRFISMQDKKACEKARNVKIEDFCEHPNQDFEINIIKDSDFEFLRVWDIFSRIKEASENNDKLVLILPQPHPMYSKVAYLINKFRVDCSKLYTFNMDEWADENGNIAPETWPHGFLYAMKNNFYYQLDEDLRPPEEQIQGPTNENFADYGKMIDDLGGADVCYGGIGWSGHIAFIEPGAKEYEADSLEEWKQMGPKIVEPNLFTICQSSLSPEYGMSGDWSAIPPKAATIGPAQVVGAKLRSSWNSFTLASTDVSWQRFTVRMAVHGPVTPDLPASILQTLPTEMYVSEKIAQNIEEQ